MPKIQAILFDLDGVLTDTSEYHYRAWKQMANEEGISLTREENDTHLRGVGRRESLEYIIRDHKFSEDKKQEMMQRKNDYYNELIKTMTPDELISGGRALLQEIREAGIKSAVASASRNCQTVLERLNIVDLFDGIADGNCVVNSKPASDIFVFAAGLVHTSVTNCLGIEDADAGIEAIKTAGMYALGVGPATRFHRADHVIASMENVHLKDILPNE